MKVNIVNNLTKKLKTYRKKLDKFDGMNLEVGYFDSKVHRESELTFASLMQLLHDGYGNVPARPVIRKTLEQLSRSKRYKIENIVKKHVKKGSDPETMIREMGDIIVKEIQGNFGAGNSIGLAPNPQPNPKGRNDPLVDTGSLRDNLEARIT